MRLSNLIRPNDGLQRTGDDREIAGITADSRAVQPGFLFIAIPGTQHDGRGFIGVALAAGAIALLVPDDYDRTTLPATISVIAAADVRLALSLIAARFYPDQPRMIAAITGTSGKTSTAQFLRELWALNGAQAASLGTLGLITPTANVYGSLTTPDAITLHRTLDEISRQGITHLAMEASSHGLALHRLDQVRLGVAGFTNLSRDHLDYHPTMEDYFAAKLRLFTELLPEGAVAVLNADSDRFAALQSACLGRHQQIIGYGKAGHEIQLLDFQPHARGQTLRFKLLGKAYDILLPVIGAFQVWNSLCALGMALGSGMEADAAIAGLTRLSGVPGRLELVGTTPNGGTVFVDYAHKPDALENVLTALRPHVAAHPGARLRVVFGCGGNRDTGKRPLMGAIAQRLADDVIVTDDNPRREPPAAIRQAVLAGCAPGPNLREIGDRAQAIAAGIAALRQGDVLVIAGKGHEHGQIIGDEILPFDDAAIARQFIGRT